MADEQQIITSADYQELLTNLKEQFQLAQLRAAAEVNREVVTTYWYMGQAILKKQKELGWGAKVIDRLAADLQRAFPEQKGFSPRNLKYMRAFAEAYQDEQFVQQAAAQIPWGHNVRILEQVKDPLEREWYIRKTLDNGWSRDILALQIERELYQRQGKANTNFSRTLPAPQSDLARQVLKDPYNFDFLDLGSEAQEREVERGLTEHIREFLIELGAGFAFMGSQYHMQVRQKDYYLDLLFYHVKLRCYVVIDLKATEFKAEYVGKMNLYLAIIDDFLRHPDDQPSIGLILCKTKDSFEAEYALRGVTTPIGISGYEAKLTKALPDELKGSLPTIEELEAELETTTQNQEEGGF